MQKSLSCSTAAFTYFYTVSLQHSVVRSLQIFSVFPPQAFWTSDHPFQSPSSPQTIKLKLNQLQEWQSLTQLCDSTCWFLQELGAQSPSFTVSREGCSVKSQSISALGIRTDIYSKHLLAPTGEYSPMIQGKHQCQKWIWEGGALSRSCRCWCCCVTWAVNQ